MQTSGDPLNNYPTDQLGDRSDGMQLFGGMGSNQSGFGSGSGPGSASASGSSFSQLFAGGDSQQSGSGFGGGLPPNRSGGDAESGGMGMDAASAALAFAGMGFGRDVNAPPSSGMSQCV